MNRHKHYANTKITRIYAVCTRPIDNIVLCLESLLIACAKASLHLAIRRKVPSMKINRSYTPDAIGQYTAVQNNIAAPVPSPG